jgi:hypothetical protein
MHWSWLDLNFPWVGLFFALVLIVLLLATNLLRSDPKVSRWRDPSWLGWLAMTIYLLHNVEEYGIDLMGQVHAFPGGVCSALGLPPYPDCSLPPAFYLAVNIPLFWLAAPIAALLSRRFPFLGLTLYGVTFVNALVHLMTSLLATPYNAGVFTAVVLFLPASLWVAYACFRTGPFNYKGLALIVAEGVFLHIILMGSMQLFVRNIISANALVLIQVFNAVVYILIPWMLLQRGNGSWVYRDGHRLARV